MTEYEAFKFYGKCGIRRPNDQVAIKACVKKAIKDLRIMPNRVFVETIKDDPKHVAVLYNVPRDELIKDSAKREENVELLIENVIDDFYDYLGDAFRKDEPEKRSDYDKWARKII